MALPKPKIVPIGDGGHEESVEKVGEYLTDNEVGWQEKQALVGHLPREHVVRLQAYSWRERRLVRALNARLFQIEVAMELADGVAISAGELFVRMSKRGINDSRTIEGFLTEEELNDPTLSKWVEDSIDGLLEFHGVIRRSFMDVMERFLRGRDNIIRKIV